MYICTFYSIQAGRAEDYDMYYVQSHGTERSELWRN